MDEKRKIVLFRRDANTVGVDAEASFIDRLRAFPIEAREGMAAAEFALLLPFLGVLFFGMLEGSDILTVDRRIANASNAVADLVAQQTDITNAELDQLVIGVRRILEPTPASQFSVRVVSLIRDPSDPTRVIVHWSRDDLGTVPYAAGSVYDRLDDDTTVNAISSVIIAEVTYTYSSQLTDQVFSNPFMFSKSAKRWPRQSLRVNLCQNPDRTNCTT